MPHHEAVLQTRRSFLGLAVGVLAAGCASGGPPPTGLATANSCPSGPAQGFPYPRPWGWNGNMTAPLDLLGQLIMQAQNPYCVHPASPPTSCVATDANTWPQELTDESTWKILTEFDFQGVPSASSAHWNFGTQPPPSILRSMRIPYLIRNTAAKKGIVNSKKLDVGRENLLVGFEVVTGGSIANATEWGEPTLCPPGVGQGDAVGLLAKFIVINMMRPTDTGAFFLPQWNVPIPTGQLEPALSNTWSFRGAAITVDYCFRFPVATGVASNPQTGQAAIPQTAGRIYVGYEGGGAY